MRYTTASTIADSGTMHLQGRAGPVLMQKCHKLGGAAGVGSRFNFEPQNSKQIGHFSAVGKMPHPSSAPELSGSRRDQPEPASSRMEPRPEPDPTDPWQLLRLRAKILSDDISRARQQLVETKGNRDRARISRLEQAGRAAQRTILALNRVVYP
jgi:hypothetical protein